MFGHSLGENGCAYTDGCFTKYQTIMAAYFRGKASSEIQIKKGLMAAVGTLTAGWMFPLCVDTNTNVSDVFRSRIRSNKESPRERANCVSQLHGQHHRIRTIRRSTTVHGRNEKTKRIRPSSELELRSVPFQTSKTISIVRFGEHS